LFASRDHLDIGLLVAVGHGLEFDPAGATDREGKQEPAASKDGPLKWQRNAHRVVLKVKGKSCVGETRIQSDIKMSRGCI
jgi:hypothetical protein